MRLGSVVKVLPAPAIIALVGLALLWLLSRWDGAQTARLAELDRQQAATVAHSLEAARTYRATQAASAAADAELERLRAREATQRQRAARFARLADSLTAQVAPILAGQPDSVALPIRALIAAKDSQVTALVGQLALVQEVADTLLADRDRWRAEAGIQRALAVEWEAQAGRWRGEARRGCLPLVGCVSRSAVAVVAGGLGLAGGLLAR